jgi:hypothetical protein
MTTFNIVRHCYPAETCLFTVRRYKLVAQYNFGRNNLHCMLINMEINALAWSKPLICIKFMQSKPIWKKFVSYYAFILRQFSVSSPPINGLNGSFCLLSAIRKVDGSKSQYVTYFLTLRVWADNGRSTDEFFCRARMTTRGLQVHRYLDYVSPIFIFDTTLQEPGS